MCKDPNVFQLDKIIVNKLQDAARNGFSVANLVKTLRLLIGQDSGYELLILRYFMEAFNLKLIDAIKIRDAHCMGNSAISDEDLDSFLRPLILKHIQ